MTPLERAEALTPLGGVLPITPESLKKFRENIAAQIEEAEKEAVEKDQKKALDVSVFVQKAYAVGFRAAREKAKGIAENHGCEDSCKDIGLGPFCTIAQRISEIQP